MSTALLESPVDTDSIPDAAPSLAESFSAMVAKSFADAAVDMSFVQTPPVYAAGGWINTGTIEWSPAKTVDWSAAKAADPYPMILSSYPMMLSSFYYGSRERYTVSKPADLARFSRTAVERIERIGWAQGAMQDSWGRMCALGALRSAGATDWDLEAINRVACKVLADRGHVDPLSGRAYTSIARWNDRPGRTAGEVTALLRAAAEVLDAQSAGDVRTCPCCAPGYRAFEPTSLSV